MYNTLHESERMLVQTPQLQQKLAKCTHLCCKSCLGAWSYLPPIGNFFTCASWLSPVLPAYQ